MSNISDGGRAFPCEGGATSGLHADPGMSLLEYFAAAALTGLLSSIASDDVRKAIIKGAENRGMSKESFVAETAYVHAVAMLAASSKYERAP